MKRNIILIILLFVGEQIYSQNEQYTFEPENVGFSPGMNTLSLMSGYGNSGLLNDVSNIGAINPAALQNFNKAIGLSYQFNPKFQDPWISYYNERINQNIPQSIGIAFPISSFEIGLSMHQKFNTSISFSTDQLKLSTSPDAPSYSDYFDFNRVLFNYSISLSYALPEFIKNSFFSIGFRYGFNNYLFHETSNSAHLNESFYKSDYAIGTVYTLRKEENDFIQLGLYYESALSFSKTAKWDGDLRSIFVDQAPQLINPYIKLYADFPPALRFDFDFSPSKNIKLLGSISDVYWRTIDELTKNEMEYSGSFDYSFNKLISASIGFNYIERKFSENSDEGYFFVNELFLTAGILIKYENINLHLAIADGQLIKNKSIEQTFFNTSISYNF
jgi:hypothetical protein